MSVENFIPEVWLARVLTSLERQHVFMSAANTSFQGAISGMGSQVKFNQIGDITILDYVKNQTTLTVQELTDAQRNLLIDTAKYFAFKVDDVDAVQVNVELSSAASKKGGEGLANQVDLSIAGLWNQSGLARNTAASPVSLTSSNIEAELLAVGEQMDDADIGRDGRFMVIPSWVHTRMVQAGLTTKTQNDELFTNGRLFRVLGFDFLMSNNVSHATPATNTGGRLITGIRGESYGVAMQLSEMEAYRQTSEGFGDVVKGLLLYGVKTIRPDTQLTFYATAA